MNLNAYECIALGACVCFWVWFVLVMLDRSSDPRE